MKINKNIEAYSMQLAFGILLEENPDIKETSFTDITDIVGDRSLEPYRELGLLFCKRTCNVGNNDNKTQFRIQDDIQPGTKDWSTEYILCADFKSNNKAIIINDKISYEKKSEAEIAAKLWVAENKRDIHIRMVKIMKNGNPVSTSVLYRPSPKQSLGVYYFFN